MAAPLFSQQQQPHSRLGGAGTTPGALLEFKAGRLFRDGETNWVRPDPRKGLCFLKKEDDGLLRFCWKDRQANQVDEELIVFPGDVTFEKVQQSSGRVYVLKFKSSAQRQFFWIQEPATATVADDDKAIAHSVNVLLSSEDGSDSDGDDLDFGDDAVPMDDDTDIRMLLGQPVNEAELRSPTLLRRRNSREAEVLSHHREQSALAQENSDLSHGALPSAQVGGVPGNSLRRGSREGGSDITSIGSSSGGGIGSMSPAELNNLRQLLSSIRVPEDYASARGRGAGALKLGDVLTPQNLAAVLRDDKLRQSLFPTLPEDIPHTEGSLDQVVRSPQFQQALNSLSYVLESGQIAPLVSQLGLEPEASTSVEAFLQAIEKQVEKENQSDSSAGGKEASNNDTGGGDAAMKE